jgi:hypothetical protein
MDKEYIRTLVWEGLLDADFRTQYFGRLAGNLQSRERGLAIVLGALSSGAFVSLIAKFHLDFVPPILSFLTALLSVFLANMKLGKSAALSASIYSKWTSIKSGYETLWSEIDSLDLADINRRRETLEAEHKKEDETAAQEFTIKNRLAKKCQADVMRMRRLVETT